MQSPKSNWYGKRFLCGAVAVALLLSAGALQAQSASPGPLPVGSPLPPVAPPPAKDPGPRPGAPLLNQAGVRTGGGHPISGMPGDQITFWVDGLILFGTTASVKGTAPNETLAGLGPAFNGNSCLMCHSQPAIGGTSPAQNPQFAAATDQNATNSVPYFLSINGPVREARFVTNADGTPDGGVHELFTIDGRSDAPANCLLNQPDFASERDANNISFRIPIATFGDGFAENTTDQELQANLAANASAKAALKIAGRFNTNGNDGTITRFGWKAQNKSLLLFAGEASNVELGISNEIFPNEKVPGAGCATNFTPEDNTHLLIPVVPSGGDAGDAASQVSSLIENFAIFMRLNAVPNQCDFASGQDSSGNALCKPLSASALRGQALFDASSSTNTTGLGCVLCHSNSLVTNTSNIPQLSNVAFQPFSDYALHHMGSTLADGVSQGQAGPDEFRTAPLWGLGQRLFYLHDGRAGDLISAIEAHSSPATQCTTIASASETFILNGASKSIPSSTSQFCGSEANGVIAKYNALTSAQQQDLLNYLRSL